MVDPVPCHAPASPRPRWLVCAVAAIAIVCCIGGLNRLSGRQPYTVGHFATTSAPRPLVRASAGARRPTAVRRPAAMYPVAAAAQAAQVGPAAAAAEPFLSDVAVTAAAPWAYSGPVLLTDPAPSGINMLPGWEQQLWFVASMSIVLLGTVAIKQLALPFIKRVLPSGWYERWSSTFPLLGGVFALAGAAHFLLLEEFSNIYPPPGAWGGLWQLPGSAAFHVEWTGVVELLGGLGLLGAGMIRKDRDVARLSAFVLFCLVIAVTPANIYMFTHGAQLPPGQEVPLNFHAVRAVMQMVLLSFLWEIAVPLESETAASAEDPK